MQSFPIGNLHAHAQVLLGYLRLLGIEPTADGALRVGDGGGSFRSAVFELDGAGHGSLDAIGPVRVVTPAAVVGGGPGQVRW